MALVHCFQFFLLSVCINSFTIFMYVIYHGDLLWTSYNQSVEEEYDYIIVGSGTAGSVIAQRLVSETNHTFVVLEAGGSSNFLFDVPVLGPLLHGSVYDWQYETVPQENACYAMENKKCQLFQGKIIGGSSKLNNMIHVRGNISHYLDWFHGEYDEEFIRRHFEFVEDNILNLDEIRFQSELADAILEAAEELGYHTINVEFEQGFRKSKVSQKNGKRWSASNSLDSKYIKIDALVQKVLVTNNKAYGVSVIVSDKEKNIYARKGVILSAGSLNTPKILQLSGIGPSELLKPLDIRVVKDLPVGKNLQDHIGTGLDLIMFNKSLSISAIDMLNVYYATQYFVHGKGPFTTPGCEVVGFISTKNESTPDLQFMVLPVGISSDRGTRLRTSLAISDLTWYNYFAKSFEKHTATILPLILHPKSKGDVRIRNKDPKSAPLIDPKYLSKRNDVDTLIRGLKLIVNFIDTHAMRKIGAYINPMPFPGCERYLIFSDQYWECYIRHLTLTSYHPVGTCAMGLSAEDSVVDTSFQVFGISSLYVADGSVLPTLPSGNINAAIAMMASVFFEANFLSKSKLPRPEHVCNKKDYLDELLFKICIFK
ncbi:glucose dehydrogenase [FAD, quinone] [Amyelois transitella]|uniref:glucose dehydrogenase [FAD, quinone] n=1 Tax=Amyelois transitella TaxID=680683 RepID=UPI00298FBDBD|nr:glucose dehydrogenase [FAD, quinone] [Amyelois transitella]